MLFLEIYLSSCLYTLTGYMNFTSTIQYNSITNNFLQYINTGQNQRDKKIGISSSSGFYHLQAGINGILVHLDWRRSILLQSAIYTGITVRPRFLVA